MLEAVAEVCKRMPPEYAKSSIGTAPRSTGMVNSIGLKELLAALPQSRCAWSRIFRNTVKALPPR